MIDQSCFMQFQSIREGLKVGSHVTTEFVVELTTFTTTIAFFVLSYVIFEGVASMSDSKDESSHSTAI